MESNWRQTIPVLGMVGTGLELCSRHFNPFLGYWAKMEGIPNYGFAVTPASDPDRGYVIGTPVGPFAPGLHYPWGVPVLAD